MASKLSDSKALIKELEILLNYAEKVYTSYISSKKIFLYAKILFDINSEINNILKLNIGLLSKKNRLDAYELIFHLDIWLTIWIDEEIKQKPHLDEPFSFSNNITFPKESVKRLLLLK